MIEEENEKKNKRNMMEKSFTWCEFFKAFKETFTENRVSIATQKPSAYTIDEDIYITLELHLETQGKHSLTLHQRKIVGQEVRELNNSFVAPLLDFFVNSFNTSPADKVSELEYKLRRNKEYYTYLENKQRGHQQLTPTVKENNHELDIRIMRKETKGSQRINDINQSDEISAIPVEDVLSFLQEMKKKYLMEDSELSRLFFISFYTL